MNNALAAAIRRNPALSAILFTAGIVRLWGIGFGLPATDMRPDEWGIVQLALHVFRDRNPGFFRYPSLFIYAVAAANVILFNLGRLVGLSSTVYGFLDWANAYPTLSVMIARLIVATLGTATVGVTFTAARRLFGPRVALVSACFLALAFLHVRDSHFGVTDVPATFLVVVSYAMVVRAWQSGARRDLLLAGIAGGLATSTKYNALIVLLPALLLPACGEPSVSGASGEDAVGGGARAAGAGRASGQPVAGGERAGRFGLRDYGVYVLVFAGAFIATTPFAVLDWRRFAGDVSAERVHLLTGHGVDLGLGWIAHLTISLRHGLGLPLLITALTGMAWLAWRDWRKAVLACSFPLAYYAGLGSGRTVFVRYMIPVVPFLCVTAGCAVSWTVEWLATRVPAVRRVRVWALVALVAVIIAPTARRVVLIDRLLNTADSRLLAAHWLAAHGPRTATIYQTGSTMAHVPLGPAFDLDGYCRCAYDESSREFTEVGRSVRRDPDFVVVSASPITQYTPVHADIQDLVARRYRLVYEVRAYDPDVPNRVFDMQDAFFLPLSGFTRVVRPGPNIRIYARSIQ
jgi:hypothetical protein